LPSTLYFTPKYGPEAVWGGSGNELTGNIRVNLIFVGGSTGFGFDRSVSAQDITTAVDNLFASGYFNGLFNMPSLSVTATYVNMKDNLPATFQMSDVINNIVKGSLDDNGGTLPDPSDVDVNVQAANGVYAVFLPPTNNANVPYALSGQPNEVGSHDQGWTGENFLDEDDAPTAVVMSAQNTFALNHKNDAPNTPDAFTPLNALDSITTILSHEVVEMITDVDPTSEGGMHVDATSSFAQAYPQVTQNPGELGDNEAEMHIGYVNCVAVQSYWYVRNTEFYGIPDGTRQRLCLQGQSLIIPGDRLGPADKQTLGISTVAGGVQINLNGDVYQYAPGQVTSISIDLGPGSNTINVDGLPAGVSLTVNEAAGGNDTINLAASGNGLANIQGPISVKGGGGKNQVTLGGSFGGALTDALTDPRSGSLPLGSFTFSYNDVGTLALSPSGTIGQLILQGGQFVTTEQDTVTDAGVGSIQFDGAMPDHGTLNYSSVTELDDLVQVPSATYDFTGDEGVTSPYVAIVDGPVVNSLPTTSLQQTITYLTSNLWSISSHTVMDRVDFANKSDVTVQGGSQNATIDLNNPNPAARLGTLEIDPGLGTTTVTVESTPGPAGAGSQTRAFAPAMKAGGGGGPGPILGSSVATTVSNSGRFGDVETVELKGPQGVQAIDGPVDIENPNVVGGGQTNLVLDDTGDTKARNVSLLDGQVTGLAPAAITWGAILSLTVTGGSGGNSFSVSSFGRMPSATLNAGSGGDTFTVALTAMSGYGLTVNGGPGYDQLDINVLSPATIISQNHGVVFAHTPGSGLRDSGIGYKDIEKLDINQPSPPGDGGDGNGGTLPPSLGGLSFLPQNLGGPEQGPQQFAKHHKGGVKERPLHLPTTLSRHGKQVKHAKVKRA
jgi:hypothetical protein